MKIVFFGSSHFAVPSLEGLLACGHEVLAVVTQPDRPCGRGLHLAPTSVKNLALKHKLNIFQPQKINTSDSIDFLKKSGADLFVVIAYGQILSSGILKIPKIMPLNVHASLLPKYRGAAPINWSIILGEKVTGVTVMKMTEIMDAGPMLLQKEITIESDDNALTLEKKLSELAASALIESVNAIEKGNHKLSPQEEKAVTFAPKLKKEDGRINWGKPALEIHNLVRGSLEWPGAFTCWQGKLIKIYSTEVCPLSGAGINRSPGEVVEVSNAGIIIAAGKEGIKVKELQPEAKKIMKAEEFIAGHKISVGEILK